MLTLDISRATPIERSALAAQAALMPAVEVVNAETGERTTRPATAEEFAAAFVARSLDSWKRALVEAKLPELRPHAEMLLDLSAEDQAAAVAFMRELRRRAGALDDGAGAIDTPAV
jgi:hypothetical protein